jgi:pimeloyl-ACP methyl ester carboxylesterase
MSFLLVHGLGLSSNIWSRLVPLLDGEVIALDLPGHGASNAINYSWSGIWKSISEVNRYREWSQTILVLHSFTASLLPEIIKKRVRPCKVVIIEGILNQHDTTWSDVVATLTDSHFDNWLLRFKDVSEMALKSQLVTRQTKSDIQVWSSSFRIVNGDSLRVMARNLKKRLSSDEIEKSLGNLEFPLIYIRGKKSRLSEIGLSFLQERSVSIIEIANSGHFPMIDNPVDLSVIINNNSPLKIGIDHEDIPN